MAKIIQFLGGLVLTCLLCMGGCKLLVKSIFNRQDCERFNIDNIEVRTGINIPAVTDCKCESQNMTKTSVFTLDTSVVNIDEYRVKHLFKKSDSVYVRQNVNEYTDWEARLNTETAELSFILHYLK